MEFSSGGVDFVALAPADAAALLELFADAKQAAGECDNHEVEGSGAVIASFYESSILAGSSFSTLPEPFQVPGAIVLPPSVHNGMVLFIEAIQGAPEGCSDITVEQARNAAVLASGEAGVDRRVAPEPHPWTKVGIVVGAIGTLTGLYILIFRGRR